MLKKNKKLVIITVAVLVVVLIAGFALLAKNGNQGLVVKVVRGVVEQKLLVTGTLKPAEEIDLSFQNSGKVSNVFFKVGDQVVAGEVIVRLDDRDVLLALAEARNDYDDLINIEAIDITKAENDVKTYEENLTTAYDDGRATVIEASKNFNDVVNGLDDFFSKDGYLASDNFFLSGAVDLERGQAEDYSDDARQALDVFLKNYRVTGGDRSVIETDLNNISTVAYLVLAAAKKTKDLITYSRDRDLGIESEADAAYNLVTSLTATSDSTFADVLAAKNNIAETKRLLGEAKLDLADLLDGPDKNDLEAKILAIKQQEKILSDYRIASPIAGVITKQEAEVGEVVVSNTVLVTVISAGNMEIEANVPEVLIGQVVVGNQADVEFDAFGGEKFSGVVKLIDPAQTVIDGVVNYQVTITLNQVEEKLRSGLTANVTIKTLGNEQALLVPQEAISAEGTVEVVNNGQTEIRQVELGARNDDGLVEVVSGLTDGEAVLIRQ